MAVCSRLLLRLVRIDLIHNIRDLQATVIQAAPPVGLSMFRMAIFSRSGMIALAFRKQERYDMAKQLCEPSPPACRWE
jgi:hypothetical protein